MRLAKMLVGIAVVLATTGVSPAPGDPGTIYAVRGYALTVSPFETCWRTEGTPDHTCHPSPYVLKVERIGPVRDDQGHERDGHLITYRALY